MPSYNYRSFIDLALDRRFPDFEGFDLWRNLVRSPNQENLDELRIFELNISVRKKAIDFPRVFISHRQADTDYAKRIAQLAEQKNFEYWLDVFDPRLQSLSGATYSKDQMAILTAGIIEMALINCTHVLAVMTLKLRAHYGCPMNMGGSRKFLQFTDVHRHGRIRA